MSAVLVTSDLMVASRVTSVAKEISLPIVVVAQCDAAVQQAIESAARVMLVDLAMPGLQTAEWVSQLRGPGVWAGAIIAFGPHVDEAGLESARRAGCDKVLARGQFLNQLAAILLPYVRLKLAEHER